MLRRYLFAIVILAFVNVCDAATPRPIILTTDCGAEMDDQWALAHLVLTPEFDVRAIVTTHTGKIPIFPAPAAETSARFAGEVLDHLPLRSRPTIIAGSSVALSSHTAIRNAGVERIILESRTFNRGRRLTVLVIGAATDAASALLADPSLADRIEIVAMGFSGWPKGGDHFNVVNDPIAWQVILNSRVPLTVGDEPVTLRDLSMTSERAHAILDPAGDPGRYLAGLLDKWLANSRDVVMHVTGDPTRWSVWDEVVVAHMLGMTKAERHTRPKLREDLSFDNSAGRGVMTWVTAIDGGRLWTHLSDRLQQAQRTSRVGRIAHPATSDGSEDSPPSVP
jgi:inosine-uridine nucleoside N-ribohydrolase